MSDRFVGPTEEIFGDGTEIESDRKKGPFLQLGLMKSFLNPILFVRDARVVIMRLFLARDVITVEDLGMRPEIA